MGSPWVQMIRDLVLMFWKDLPELGTRPSKDEQESHRDVIGKLAYRLKFVSSVMTRQWHRIEIWILNHSKSIMRDIDLSGSALLN